MKQDMVCPACGNDVPVTDQEIKGHNIVTHGLCPEDGECFVVE